MKRNLSVKEEMNYFIIMSNRQMISEELIVETSPYTVSYFGRGSIIKTLRLT